MIFITPSRVFKYLLLGVIIPGIVIFFHLTRYNYVPVQVTLGDCQMDYTSPLSYQERVSPLESTELEVMGWNMLLCYGQPSAKGRKVMGDLVNYDELWRFGANEPTRFYTTADIAMGDLVLPKGRYSLYAKPGKFEWEIFVNRSISHWGNDFSDKVRNQEVGSFKVRSEYNGQTAETLRFSEQPIISAEKDAVINGTELIFEWENTHLTIPITILETKNKSGSALQQEIMNKSQELKDLEESTGTSADDVKDILNQ